MTCNNRNKKVSTGRLFGINKCNNSEFGVQNKLERIKKKSLNDENMCTLVFVESALCGML